MLAVVYKRIAIPIDWVLLHKKGNSNTRERIALMSDLLSSLVPKTLFVFWQTENLLAVIG
jgi:hypothetical protein